MEESLPEKFSWKTLLKVRILLPVVAGSCLLYWTAFDRPYLRLDDARVAAPFMQVRTELKGKVGTLHHSVGDYLHQGDALCTLQREKEETLRSSLQANLTSLEDRLGRSLSGIEKAMDEYINACAHVEMGLCSSEVAEQSLQLLQQEQADIYTCKQNIEGVKTDLERLGREIAQKTIYAPCAGVVTQQYKSEGDAIDSGEIVYSLCDVKRIYIEAMVPECKLGAIAVGQKTVVSLPAYPGKSWTGAVSWISPVAQEKTGTVQIRIALDDPSQESFRPHLSAKAIVKVR